MEGRQFCVISDSGFIFAVVQPLLDVGAEIVKELLSERAWPGGNGGGGGGIECGGEFLEREHNLSWGVVGLLSCDWVEAMGREKA